MSTTNRKVGRPKEDLSSESGEELIKKTKSLIRTDWGGKDPLTIIKQQMAERGIDAGPKSCQAILEICKNQVEGCRKRTERRHDEAISRFQGKRTKFEESMD
jgi:hypothetical protein